MESHNLRRPISFAISVVIVSIFLFFASQNIGSQDFIGIAYGGSTASTTVNVTATSPVISSVNINGTNPSTITLTANSTVNVNIEATITDNNGCGEITGGTTTILFYRSGVTSSSCQTNSGNGISANLNCYTATAFTASSSCSGGVQNTTTTFPVEYFAQATDGSSQFSSQNWMATVIVTSADKTTGSGDSSNASTTNDIATLTALNITTSSINYGSLQPGSTSGNSTTTVANAGNSSSTLELNAAQTLVSGSNSISTSSQHYATSSFTYGGGEQQLSGTAASVGGFVVTAPTSTTNVQSSIFWALQVPNGSATGTYSGVNQFTAVFTN